MCFSGRWMGGKGTGKPRACMSSYRAVEAWVHRTCSFLWLEPALVMCVSIVCSISTRTTWSRFHQASNSTTIEHIVTLIRRTESPLAEPNYCSSVARCRQTCSSAITASRTTVTESPATTRSTTDDASPTRPELWGFPILVTGPWKSTPAGNRSIPTIRCKVDSRPVTHHCTNYFIETKHIYSHATRGHETNLYLAQARKVCRRNSIIIIGPKYWKLVHNFIKTASSLNIFKNRLNKYLHANSLT